jgi:hypothetical protein
MDDADFVECCDGELRKESNGVECCDAELSEEIDGEVKCLDEDLPESVLRNEREAGVDCFDEDLREAVRRDEPDGKSDRAERVDEEFWDGWPASAAALEAALPLSLIWFFSAFTLPLYWATFSLSVISDLEALHVRSRSCASSWTSWQSASDSVQALPSPEEELDICRTFSL